MYSVEFLQKKRKEKSHSYCKHTQKYKHCPKKQWNVTWVYSIKILTWLQEADNDSCGWYVTKKNKLFISSCTSSSVLLRSSRTCSQTNVCIYRHEVTMSEYFATEKKGKRQRCQIGCKVNGKKQQTWIKQQLQILSFFFECNIKLVSLTGNLPLIWLVNAAADPHPSG